MKRVCKGNFPVVKGSSCKFVALLSGYCSLLISEVDGRTPAAPNFKLSADLFSVILVMFSKLYETFYILLSREGLLALKLV